MNNTNNTFDYSRFVIDGDLYLQKGDGSPIDIQGKMLDFREKSFRDFIVSVENVGDVLLEGLEVQAHCVVSDRSEIKGQVIESDLMEVTEDIAEIAAKFKKRQV